MWSDILCRECNQTPTEPTEFFFHLTRLKSFLCATSEARKKNCVEKFGKSTKNPIYYRLRSRKATNVCRHMFHFFFGFHVVLKNDTHMEILVSVMVASTFGNVTRSPESMASKKKARVIIVCHFRLFTARDICDLFWGQYNKLYIIERLPIGHEPSVSLELRYGSFS